jgi:hypothetical protein
VLNGTWLQNSVSRLESIESNTLIEGSGADKRSQTKSLHHHALRLHNDQIPLDKGEKIWNSVN